MSIESKIPTEEINVKDLSLEKPAGELPPGESFDVERDIPKIEKQKILTYTQSVRPTPTSEGAPVFSSMAARTKILFPKEYESMGIGRFELNALTTNFLVSKNSALFNIQDANRWELMANDGSNFKLLFPEQKDTLGLDADFFEKLNQFARDNKDKRGHRPNYLLDVSILYPEKIKDLPISEDLWNILTHDIETCRTRPGSSGNSLAYAVFKAKLLYPDRASQIVLSDSDWQLMKEELKKKGGPSNLVGDYAGMAMCMKLLSEKNLRITDQGFEYDLPPQHLNAPSPSIPEIKKF